MYEKSIPELELIKTHQRSLKITLTKSGQEVILEKDEIKNLSKFLNILFLWLDK